MLRNIVVPFVRGASQSATTFIKQASNASATARLFSRRAPSVYRTLTVARLASFHTTSKAREAEESENVAAPAKPKRKKRASSASKKKKRVAKPKKAKAPAKPSESLLFLCSTPVLLILFTDLHVTERVLHPPKPINSAWVLYFKERLDVSSSEIIDMGRYKLIPDCELPGHAEGRQGQSQRAVQSFG